MALTHVFAGSSPAHRATRGYDGTVDMTALEAVGRNTVGAHIPLSPPYGAII